MGFRTSSRSALAPRCLVLCLLLVSSGCGVLPGKSTLPAATKYSLSGGFAPGPVMAPKTATNSCLSAQVMLPRAAPGFNTARMAYTEGQNQIRYFSYNSWVDAPSYMLQPLLAESLRESGRFATVVKAPSPVPTRFRLTTDELAIVQQIEGNKSVLRLGLVLQLVDLQEGHLLLNEPMIIEKETEANPQAGVEAANALVRELMTRLAEKVRLAVDDEALCQP